MKYSDLALKILHLKEMHLKEYNKELTNAAFYKSYGEKSMLLKAVPYNREELEVMHDSLLSKLSESGIDGFICAYDDEFPDIPPKVANGAKPALIFYKGDISLVRNERNVAVIGVLTPDKVIIRREENFVKHLLNKDAVIVSGLAMGCDAVSHRVCLDNGGRTIAILPTQIDKIYPKDNSALAKEIVDKGGLLISEYYSEAKDRYESTRRFIDRDRLQAMFSKAIILTASYRQGEGDSGSRHAMEAAKKYEIKRYVMFNQDKDSHNPLFGLNMELLNNKGDNIKVLTGTEINELFEEKKMKEQTQEHSYEEQLLFNVI